MWPDGPELKGKACATACGRLEDGFAIAYPWSTAAAEELEEDGPTERSSHRKSSSVLARKPISVLGNALVRVRLRRATSASIALAFRP
jgi:hypothetical protein